jgi:hypothetical protein
VTTTSADEIFTGDPPSPGPDGPQNDRMFD